MEAPKNVKAILAAVAIARQRQQPHTATWQSVADYMMPSRATFTAQPAPGANRSTKIFDSTAEEALELLAAGLHGMLTSRSQRWFYLQASNPKLRDSYAVKGWLDAVMTEMYAVFNNPASQFHSQIDQVYMDGGGFGTAIMYTQEERDTGVVFMSRHLGECLIEENALGIVDTMYRAFSWSCEKVVETWGTEVLPEAMRRAYDDGKPCPPLRIVHAVLPRHDRNFDRIDAKGMAFASMWILEDHGVALEESGYREFPYHVWRWRVRTGEVYGTGPGVRLLPDVKMLNQMFMTVMKAAQKAVDPPLMVGEAFRGLVRTYPGGINYQDNNSSSKIEAIESRARVDLGADLLDGQRQMVRRGFYRDAFDLTADSDGQNVKATFTLQRRDDKFRQLSPVFSNCDAGLLEPIIMRVYSVLGRQGRFPPPPAELDGETLSVEYISPVARAMRTAEADDINRLLELAAALGAVNPDVYDNIDMDATARLAGEQLFNVPFGVLRSKDDVLKFRDARREQQAAQTALQTAIDGAGALKDVASANKDFTAQ